MARTVTLGVLRNDVLWQADLLGTTARNANSDVNRAINQSIQHFRVNVSRLKYRQYLTSHTGTLTAGAAAGMAYGTLDTSAWTPSLLHLYGFDITVNGRLIPLELISFEQRDDFQRAEVGASPLGPPVAVAYFGENQIVILPASDGAYAYTAYYLPVLADLVADSDTFDGSAGWEEWIKWDVVIKLIHRDQFPTAYQSAVQERDRIWADIERDAPSKQIGLVRRIDTRGLRADRIQLYRNWIRR